MARNGYTYQRNFLSVSKDSKGRSFRRVYEEGYKNKKGHTIGINQTYSDVPKQYPFKGSVAIDYSVEDSKNPKNNKTFKMYSSKGLGVNTKNKEDAKVYARNLVKYYDEK